MKTTKFVIFLLLFVLQMSTGTALKCFYENFEVNSTRGRVSEPVPGTILQCDEGLQCFKGYSFDNGTKKVWHRGCLANCTELEEKFEVDDCTLCSTDLCNSLDFRIQCIVGEGGETEIKECQTEHACFVEQYEGKEISKGCGSCANKVKYAHSHQKAKLDGAKAKIEHNPSIDYTCKECNTTSLCNKDLMPDKLLERQYCYGGAKTGFGEFFIEEECYMHHNQSYCIKEQVDGGIVYKRCGNCHPLPAKMKSPIPSDPPNKKYHVRECLACKDNLCNGAIGKLQLLTVWLLLFGVGVPILLMLPSVVNPFDGA